MTNQEKNAETIGDSKKPDYSIDFPAKLLTTPLAWDDLILDSSVMEELNEINSWIRHGETLMKDWGLEKKLKKGFRALFYGPPGTGKTLAASLLGKVNGLDAYKIDLSALVSKYIGETEKNLAKIFDAAEISNWILFFDEADALFGKRTKVGDANDRYANQEVSYLLQRIEDFNGVVILATNLKSNMDEAFSRRFQTIINFPMPGAAERLQIWNNAFPNNLTLEPGLTFDEIANNYELSGGSIINIVRFVCLKIITANSTTIEKKYILEAIKREIQKTTL
jgi:SpoVK/Ycf46/Vps4 family AAA+-type ATPase